MIISDLNSISCQLSANDPLLKAELRKTDIGFSNSNRNLCDSTLYSAGCNGIGGKVGTSMVVESCASSTTANNYGSLAVFRTQAVNGVGFPSFNLYGGSYMDYGGNHDDSNEPPELRNATLEANEKRNEIPFISLDEPQVSSALEAALMSYTTVDADTSRTVRSPRFPHLITCSEMSALDISKLNSAKCIVLPHNRGNGNMKREWRNVGWFTSEEEMDRVRKSQRVSKWKTVDQINGLKVFFRCNKWKRTSCNYRMYVMYYATDRISLNESGEHDHSTLNADYKPRQDLRKYAKSPCARAVIEATPSSSQQHALDQFILKSSQAFLSGNTYDHDNVFDTNESGRNQSRPPSRIIGSSGEIVDGQGFGAYNLSDGQNIGELLQVASDMDLTFSFNSRKNCEYCFESNVAAMKGKVVVFVDLGDRVSVTERHHGCDQSKEEWRKADWKQFLWAVRGKCMNALKNT